MRYFLIEFADTIAPMIKRGHVIIAQMPAVSVTKKAARAIAINPTIKRTTPSEVLPAYI